MNRHYAWLLKTSCLFILAAPLNLAAEPIQAGNTSFPTRAIQDIVLLAGTSINPGPEIPIPGFFGDGIFGFVRETQVGDTIVFNSTIDTAFYGSLPGFGDYVFGAVGPYEPSDYSGTITNIVQDPSDPGFASGDPSSFVSGDWQAGGAGFALEFTSGPLVGIVLETDTAQSFGFQGLLDGLPPSPGTLFTNMGDDVLNVLFNGEVVGTSSNRRLLVIPEPSLFPLLMTLAMGLVVTRHSWR